ncbi:hypothetical protein FD755_019434 [Muntiacus reevesi]|uniref:Sodium/calcium exchanger membrane region domain-containing protein n=1 Tax=Muntiacus reevesi TaxID=9886 RepID=A0A5N3X8E1_MUNRE|nr:hypothetical protein FD755_019434 [Muntiacus reevesi]
MDSWPCPLLAGVLADAISLFPLQALYMFYALAIVCDDFFTLVSDRIEPEGEQNQEMATGMSGLNAQPRGSPRGGSEYHIHGFPKHPTPPAPNSRSEDGPLSPEVTGAGLADSPMIPSSCSRHPKKLHLSEDVAGATFMAAGSSTPELFASVIGVFITHGDVGVGTIVGSAVFNILCIIGVCGLFAGQVVRLTWWAVCRDSVYYTLSVIVLIAFIYDEEIVWWEGLVLIILYVFYILIMKYNVKMQAFFTIKQKTIANGNTVNSELEDGNDYCDSSSDDPSLPLLGQVKEEPQYNKNPVVMVDEVMSSSPPKFTFPEAGLRVMITNKFGPRTRLRMASRIIINERQRLINSANGVSSKPLQNGRHESIENGNVPVENPEEPQRDQEPPPQPPPPPQEPEPVEAAFLSPFSMPGESWGQGSQATLLGAPRVTIIGYTLGIPDVIMGITFLAAGTSVPDCMASLIVARQGLGDMAVSNTIGSNVFDILVGLGIPWGLQTMVVNYGSTVKINSRGLVYSVALLLGSVALTVLGIHLNKWKLDRKLGVYVLVLYAVFLCFSIMIEFNIFTFVNLPMCREDD